MVITLALHSQVAISLACQDPYIDINVFIDQKNGISQIRLVPRISPISGRLLGCSSDRSGSSSHLAVS